jgi:hypothetical protein
MAAKRKGEVVTLAVGEDSWTTLAIGEENPPVTTLAMGEEYPPVTTLMLGEEGAWMAPMPGLGGPGAASFPTPKRKR